MKKRETKKYSDEFKLRGVKLCLETDKSDAEIARELGVHATTLCGWKQQYKKIKSYGMIQSMSRKGNCWDNAPSESFFHTLKVEVVYGKIYETREEAKSCLFEYIEVFYNRQRRHSTLKQLSPAVF
jgi:transposase InsO family protein